MCFNTDATGSHVDPYVDSTPPPPEQTKTGPTDTASSEELSDEKTQVSYIQST